MIARELRDHRAEMAVFLAAAAFTYLSFARPLADANPWARMAPVFSLVERGTLDIDPFVEAGRTIDWSRRDGHYYSNKAPGPMILALPVYAAQRAAQRAVGVPDDEPAARSLAAYLANAAAGVAPTLAALPLLWTVLVRRMRASPGLAFALAGTWAVGSLALPNTVLFFGHQTAAAFFAIGMCATILELDRDGDPRPGLVALAGACHGLAAISDYMAASIVGIWTAFLAWRSPRLLAPWALGGAAPALAGLAYNAFCFGSPFTTAYNLSLLNPIFVPIAGFEAPSLARLADVTVRPWRGLFYCTPVFALALAGLDRLREEARRSPEIVPAAAGAVLYFGLLAAFPSSFGGACVGPRYVTPALPLFVLLLAPAARLLPRLFGALAAGSAVMMLAATITDPLPDQSFPDPFRGRIFPMLASGDPVPMCNVFTHLLGARLPVAFGAYLGLWAACAVVIGMRLRARAARAEAAP